MNISEVTEVVVRQIIMSGRDARVVIHEDNPYGRSVEIMGFTTEDTKEEKTGETIEDIPCDYYKYGHLFEDEYPCKECCHNALDRFERKTEV